MNPLHSVWGRLSIALVLVVAGALGVAYLVVVPQLEDRLADARLAQLRDDSAFIPRAIAEVELTSAVTGEGIPWQRLAQGYSADLDGARVAFYRSNPFIRGKIDVLGDSSVQWQDVRDDEVARTALGGEVATGFATRRDTRYAEVAYPPLPLPRSPGLVDSSGTAVLVAASLDDTLETIDVVERRLLYAGLIALAIVLGVGFLAARVFAQRVRKLERAADRIAAGHFDEEVVDTGKDELGELASAFERMRQRLAHLEHARREFIANASHELRTPLFALAGLLELLDDEELDDDTRREFLATARQQSDRLTKLATDLLDLSRLDAGRLHVERETVKLDELARALADEFRAVAHAQQHPLEVLGAPAAAVGDEQRALQIGRILVENALLHTPAGTQVRIRSRVRGERALLSVEDDGPGIPSDHLEHVFDRFYRVNGAVTSGSGLGLAIARELAELMGGAIEVESRPGRTVFTLSLAAARVPAAVAVG